MADNKKITELEEVTSVSASSILLYTVDSTSGTPVGKKISGTNLGTAIAPQSPGDFLVTQVFS